MRCFDGTESEMPELYTFVYEKVHSFILWIRWLVKEDGRTTRVFPYSIAIEYTYKN